MQTEAGRTIRNPPPHAVAVHHFIRQPKQRQTAREQFLNLPEGAPSQLIAGEIVMSPSPVPLHQRIVGHLYMKLLQFAEAAGLGQVFIAPLDVALDERTIVQPDILFVSKERTALVGERMIEGSPDLVAEVLSPSSAYHDLRTKFRAYEQAGVKEYWIVDPERRSVEVYCSSGRKFHLHHEAEEKGEVQSVLLAGFSVDLNSIFFSF